MVALDEIEETIGTWTFIPSSAHATELGGRTYIEHNQNGDPSTWEFNWTAPAAGSGAVTFYAAGLANNSNGNTQGDGVATTTFTASEFGVSSVNNANQDLTKMLISPNPTVDQANVSVFSKRSGAFDLNIVSTTGQLVYTESVNLQVGENQKSVDLGRLQKGLYFLQINGEKEVITQRLIKL
ncbi:MAG: choice-of-anchor V domain-containing protein, partial [Saprospiraceae bacterium]